MRLWAILPLNEDITVFHDGKDLGLTVDKAEHAFLA